MRPTLRLSALSLQFANPQSFKPSMTTPASSVPPAIVAGVGSGTGASVARRFAQKYPVFLLARNPSNYEALVEEIQKNGGWAQGISTDVSNANSVQNAFEEIKKAGEGKVSAAVFNVGGRFIRKPFLELSEDEFNAGFEANG